MAKDTSITATNGYLHDQLMRITNPDLNGDELKEELQRAKSVVDVCKVIIEGERVVNERAKIVAEYAPQQLVDVLMPQQLVNHNRDSNNKGSGGVS